MAHLHPAVIEDHATEPHPSGGNGSTCTTCGDPPWASVPCPWAAALRAMSHRG